MNKRFSLLLAALFALPAFGSAQSSGASRIKDFIMVFNGASPASIASYINANIAKPPPGLVGPPGMSASEIVRLRAAIGRVNLQDVHETPRSIRADVSARSGWYTFTFLKAPPGMVSRGLIGLSVDLGLPAKRSDQDALAYTQSLAGRGYFSGAVLLAKPGALPVQFAYGKANRARNIANSPATMFNVASIGKLFTTAAVYQLVESGKLHLTDTIGHWLPDYPNAQAKSATIQQLLDMSSGIGDIFTQKFMHNDHSRIRALKDYLPYFASDSLLFPPGTAKMYSNGGFIVLGLIIEKASGENFYSYIQRHIFAPAAMTHSGYPTIDQSRQIAAIGYTRQYTDLATWATTPRDSLPQEPGRGSSAGGAYSTVQDLYKFAQAARNGMLVKGHYDWNGTGTWLGGAPGWNAVLSVKSAETTIVLSNEDPPVAAALAANLSTP